MPDPIVRTLDEVRQSRASLNNCIVCSSDIHMMCRKYTGICSEQCDKSYKSTIKETPNA